MPRDFNEPYYGFEDDVAKGLCEQDLTYWGDCDDKE